MTEAEWLASEDVAAMMAGASATGTPLWHAVAHVTPGGIPKGLPLSDRKLRLFACACCRQVWNRISEEYPRLCVEKAEQLADGGKTLTWCAKAANSYRTHSTGTLSRNFIGLACCLAVASEAARAASYEHTLLYADQADARRVQAALLRDVCGNPFRPMVLPLTCPECGEHSAYQRDTADPRCACCYAGGMACPWITPEVVSLATAAYEERPGRKERADCTACNGRGWHRDHSGRMDDRYEGCKACAGTGILTRLVHAGALATDRLLVLADALEEKGCDNYYLLRHLRGQQPAANQQFDRGFAITNDDGYWEKLPSPHVRGCWALDLLLGKS